ncbi:MAG TPA: hypothetical protein DCY06_12835 [Bacteroidetes bacterium]|nr:hypothetical protein [Bacteroidota bacterium]HRE09978.1 hypothetical protein [Ignavibacteria bacterium]HRF66954.1 hypothetical protein [Ignavibacteria bacterium]
MIRYKNLSGSSGITAYIKGRDYIKVRFIDGTVYTYNYHNPGREHVEKMKKLVEAGRGLSTYISVNVKGNYEQKE